MSKLTWLSSADKDENLVSDANVVTLDFTHIKAKLHKEMERKLLRMREGAGGG